jgi:hypothetical protein
LIHAHAGSQAINQQIKRYGIVGERLHPRAAAKVLRR